MAAMVFFVASIFFFGGRGCDGIGWVQVIGKCWAFMSVASCTIHEGGVPFQAASPERHRSMRAAPMGSGGWKGLGNSVEFGRASSLPTCLMLRCGEARWKKKYICREPAKRLGRLEGYMALSRDVALYGSNL